MPESQVMIVMSVLLRLYMSYRTLNTGLDMNRLLETTTTVLNMHAWYVVLLHECASQIHLSTNYEQLPLSCSQLL